MSSHPLLEVRPASQEDMFDVVFVHLDAAQDTTRYNETNATSKMA